MLGSRADVMELISCEVKVPRYEEMQRKERKDQTEIPWFQKLSHSENLDRRNQI